MQHIERSLSSCKFDTIPTLRSEIVKRSFLYMFCLQPFKVKPLEPLVAGGDNWAEMHRKWCRSTLFVQLLPQTEKAQLVTPQTIKYRYRTVMF